ncbi:MAG: hypothetical protein ABS75_07270 [Pelagibacterium sp. SCN 63-23]|nr:MAG: hypothetical protein ABS75_07270 [Pelagibacterium sp. SCN 63-23]
MAGWTDEERRAEIARREKLSLEKEAAQSKSSERQPNAECSICHRPFHSINPSEGWPICEACD